MGKKHDRRLLKALIDELSGPGPVPDKDTLSTRVLTRVGLLCTCQPPGDISKGRCRKCGKAVEVIRRDVAKRLEELLASEGAEGPWLSTKGRNLLEEGGAKP